MSVHQPPNVYQEPVSSLYIGLARRRSFALIKYIKDIGREYRTRAIELISICRTLAQDQQTCESCDELQSVQQVVDDALCSATQARKMATKDVDAKFKKATEALSTYEKKYYPRETVTQRMAEAMAKDRSTLKYLKRLKARETMRPLKEEPANIVEFHLHKSLPDKNPIIVKQVLCRRSDKNEILWNFSSLKYGMRLTSQDNPHFYEMLPTSAENYDSQFQMEPIGTFDTRYHNKIGVLADSSRSTGRVLLETAKKKRVFGNIWVPKDAIMFKDIYGRLEGESVVCSAIKNTTSSWCFERPSLYNPINLSQLSLPELISSSSTTTATSMTSPTGDLLGDWRKPILRMLHSQGDKVNIRLLDIPPINFGPSLASIQPVCCPEFQPTQKIELPRENLQSMTSEPTPLIRRSPVMWERSPPAREPLPSGPAINISPSDSPYLALPDPTLPDKSPHLQIVVPTPPEPTRKWYQKFLIIPMRTAADPLPDDEIEVTRIPDGSKKDNGREYRTQAINLISTCRAFARAQDQTGRSYDELRSVQQVVDDALYSAMEALEKTTKDADAKVKEATNTLSAYEKKYPLRDLEAFTQMMAKPDAKDKLSWTFLKKRIRETTKTVEFLLHNSLTDKNPTIVKQVLSQSSDMNEILWNFNRLKDGRRLTLKDNPHFYEILPTSAKKYDAQFRMKPIETFHHNKISVLTDSSHSTGRVFLETAYEKRAFGNVWIPNDAIIFKDMCGKLEGEKIIGLVIEKIPNLWCFEVPLLSNAWPPDQSSLSSTTGMTVTPITSSTGALLGDWREPILRMLRSQRVKINIHILDITRSVESVSSILKGILVRPWDQMPQNIEMGHTVASWCTNKNKDIAQYARCIATRTLASVRERNDRWVALATSVLGLSASNLRTYIAHGDDSLSLAILISVARQYIHSGIYDWGLLSTLYSLEIYNTLPELQRAFCSLWNECVQEASRQELQDTLPVGILRLTRVFYIHLHYGTPAAPTFFSASTPESDDMLFQPSSYPSCDVPSHSHFLDPIIFDPFAVPLSTQSDNSPNPTLHRSTYGRSGSI